MISTQPVPLSTFTHPILDSQAIQKIIKKVQDYRIGGIRMQHQQIQAKNVFHNYGHGTCAFCLSAATAFLMTKLFSIYVVDRHVQTAVIGAGINGLLTALELSKNGVPVTVYADNLPPDTEELSSNQLQKQICDGVWLPIGHDNTDILKHELLTKLSLNYYRQCLIDKKYASLQTIDLLDRERDVKELKKIVPGFLYNGYEQIQINNGGENRSYVKMKTFRINRHQFVQELKKEAMERGVKFMEKTFNSIQDVLGLQQNAIFNCSGRSSKNIFKDQNIVEKMVHYAVLKNNQKLDYAINLSMKEGTPVRVVCSGQNIIVKIERDQETSEEFIKQMVDEINRLFINVA